MADETCCVRGCEATPKLAVGKLHGRQLRACAVHVHGWLQQAREDHFQQRPWQVASSLTDWLSSAQPAMPLRSATAP